MLSRLHELVYYEHLATMSALADDPFRKERDNARDQHMERGQLVLPWLKWRPERTTADMWHAAQKRREDPAYMRELKKLQTELDTDAQKIKVAVEKELELRKKAVAYRKQQRAEQARPVRRKHVRVPKRRHALR